MRVDVAPATATPQLLPKPKPDVPELDPNSFYDFIQESSDSLVVVDWYTGGLASGRVAIDLHERAWASAHAKLSYSAP